MDSDNVCDIITTDNDAIGIDEATLQHIKLFANLIEVCRPRLARIDMTRLPMRFEISSEAMRTIVAFYHAYDMQSGTEVTKASNAAKFCALGGKLRTIADKILLIAVCDYLDASELLNCLLLELLRSVSRASIELLEKLFRCRALESEDDRPLRYQYRHAELVYRIMSRLLPPGLIGPVDTRIRRFIDRVACGQAATIILTRGKEEETRFFIEHSRFYKIQTRGLIQPLYTIQLSKEGEESLRECERYLSEYRDKKNMEIVIGDRHIGTHDALSGESRWFGELEEWTTTETIKIDMSARQTIDVAIWQADTSAVSVSMSTHLFTKRGNAFNLARHTTMPQYVIDTSSGFCHTLVLNSDSVLAFGYSNAAQLGVTHNKFINGERLSICDARIEKIFCRSFYSAVVTQSARLYVTGNFPYKSFTTWTEIPIEASAERPVTHIGGYCGMLFIVIDKTLWLSKIDIVAESMSFVRHHTFMGDVYSVVSRDSVFILVDTSEGLYLLPDRRESDAFYIEKFGGTDSTAYPYKLKFTM